MQIVNHLLEIKLSSLIIGETCTWLKYSSAIRLAHSTQHLNGRVGFDTSAHLIIILLTNITLSGCNITDISRESE